ncbi:hypothetical protein MIMGU_mgv1a026695mg, partial [Erythranthe guttata]
MFAFLSEPLMAYIASSTSSHDAWDKLTRLYANHSRSRVLFLKEKLSQTTRGTKFVSEFLQTLKSIADQLALVGSPLGEDDLILHCSSLITTKFAKKTFSNKRQGKFQDQFLGTLLDQITIINQINFVHPRPEIVANYAITGNKNNTRLLGTGSSHNVATYLQNMSLHTEYEGPIDKEHIILGDGSGLAITHVGTTQLSLPLHIFSLQN